MDQVFERRTASEIRGVKIAKFLHFCLFSPYKTPKKYFFVRILQSMGYIAAVFGKYRTRGDMKWKVQRGVFASGVFLRCLMEELGIQNFLKFRP